jgi:hypothetical protein
MMRSLSAADWNNPNVRSGSAADLSRSFQIVSFVPPADIAADRRQAGVLVGKRSALNAPSARPG